jgi:hypothetical protein
MSEGVGDESDDLIDLKYLCIGLGLFDAILYKTRVTTISGLAARHSAFPVSIHVERSRPVIKNVSASNAQSGCALSTQYEVFFLAETRCFQTTAIFMHKLEISVSHVTRNEISWHHCIDLVELKKKYITYADRMPDRENLRGAKSAPPCASALPKKRLCIRVLNLNSLSILLLVTSSSSTQY